MDRHRNRRSAVPSGEDALNSALCEDSAQGPVEDEEGAELEARDFEARWRNAQLEAANQDRKGRKTYAMLIFGLVVIWLGVVISLLVLQGALGPRNLFHLSDSILIAVSTTTTASVTALLVIVARYLFPSSRPADAMQVDIPRVSR